MTKSGKKPVVVLKPKVRGKLSLAAIRRAVRQVADERERRGKQRASDGKE